MITTEVVTIQSRPETYYGLPLEFNEATHRYRYDGRWVPGVTTVLNRLAKPALIQWAADMVVDDLKRCDRNAAGHYIVPEIHLEAARKAHAKKRDDAADVGSNVHAYAEAWLKGRTLPPLVTDQAKAGAAAFEQWMGEHSIQPVCAERRVFSREHWFAGTCDFVGVIDGELAALDFKTSSGIYPEHWLQLAAYSIALREEVPTLPTLARWVVHLNKKTGECKAERLPRDEAHEQAFLNLVTVHRVMREMETLMRPPRRKAA